MAFHSKVFPLYEIEHGNYSLSFEPKGVPVKDYLQAQGRFRKLTEKDIDLIQKDVDQNWEKLLKKIDDSK